MNRNQNFIETSFVDWTFKMTLAEFVDAAQKCESHTRQRLIGQLEGTLATIRIAGLAIDALTEKYTNTEKK